MKLPSRSHAPETKPKSGDIIKVWCWQVALQRVLCCGAMLYCFGVSAFGVTAAHRFGWLYMRKSTCFNIFLKDDTACRSVAKTYLEMLLALLRPDLCQGDVLPQQLFPSWAQLWAIWFTPVARHGTAAGLVLFFESLGCWLSIWPPT